MTRTISAKKIQPASKPADPSRGRLLLWGGGLFLATLIAYIPAIRDGGFIWDDDDYVTENIHLRTMEGLRRIWFELGATHQYYPLTHSTFWIEYHLWGLDPTGYHATNVMLHATSAVLLWVILRRLRVPLPWLIAAVFALHPVHVESVAWITERKNVLSGFFYFCALLTYLRFLEEREGVDEISNLKSQNSDPVSASEVPVSPAARPFPVGLYGLALLLFIAALLSKTVTSSLPAVILLILYWKRGRLFLRDVVPLLPFFAFGIGLGMVTSWMERNVVGAKGPEWEIVFFDRVLIAGRAVWFYFSKLIWPTQLTFMYPRWNYAAERAWMVLFPLLGLAATVLLFLIRKQFGRGPLVAWLIFVGTLFPALGFIDVYPMRFSFVADHFQYLASIGAIVLVIAGVGAVLNLRKRPELKRRLMPLSAAVLVVLGVLTWQQTKIYAGQEALWADTIRKNERSWMAHNNLGAFLLDRAMALHQAGRHAEAAPLFDRAEVALRRTLELKPNYLRTMINIAIIHETQGDYEGALAMLRETAQANPTSAEPLFEQGRLLSRLDRYDEAAEYYRQALKLDPRHEPANVNLGTYLLSIGKEDEALERFHAAVESRPDSYLAHANLVQIYARRGDEARFREHLAHVQRLRPDLATGLRGLLR